MDFHEIRAFKHETRVIMVEIRTFLDCSLFARWTEESENEYKKQKSIGKANSITKQ
jgi:hypothetical protein